MLVLLRPPKSLLRTTSAPPVRSRPPISEGDASCEPARLAVGAKMLSQPCNTPHGAMRFRGIALSKGDAKLRVVLRGRRGEFLL